MMVVPSYLLCLLGILGAADIWLFHTRAQHLHDHPPARAELVTHFLRGPTYFVLFLAVPNFSFHGAWFVGLVLLLVFDVGISIADFWLEPESRRALGGLPRGEYLLHVVMAMLFGALVADVLRTSGSEFSTPTALRWVAVDEQPWLRALLAVMAVGVLWSGFSDLAAVRRLGRGER
ncbi:MAG: hypothetical protein KDC98_13265 [Planctomycetes bacterium]|nr:hypothetical protein [Planctomycetota bacterium]